MKYLLLSSLFFLLSFSVRAQGPVEPKDSCKVDLFSDTTLSYMYHTKIHLYGHDFSGLMVLKNVGNNNYKVSINSTFGLTILAFEMIDGKFKLNEAIKQMRRKMVLKMVEADMQLLLDMKPPYNTRNAKNIVELRGYKARLTRTYTYNGGCAAALTKVDAIKHEKSTTTIDFAGYVGKTPNKINLTHHKMPVTINLERLIDTP